MIDDYLRINIESFVNNSKMNSDNKGNSSSIYDPIMHGNITVCDNKKKGIDKINVNPFFPSVNINSDALKLKSSINYGRKNNSDLKTNADKSSIECYDKEYLSYILNKLTSNVNENIKYNNNAEDHDHVSIHDNLMSEMFEEGLKKFNYNNITVIINNTESNCVPECYINCDKFKTFINFKQCITNLCKCNIVSISNSTEIENDIKDNNDDNNADNKNNLQVKTSFMFKVDDNKIPILDNNNFNKTIHSDLINNNYKIFDFDKIKDEKSLLIKKKYEMIKSINRSNYEKQNDKFYFYLKIILLLLAFSLCFVFILLYIKSERTSYSFNRLNSNISNNSNLKDNLKSYEDINEYCNDDIVNKELKEKLI